MSDASPIRLDYLDSVRGLAALYVVLGHARLDIPSELIDPVSGYFADLLSHGRIGVSVFIVLSGYCLALPSARANSFALRGGFVRYIGRRARRIYPPYLAAMALSLGMLWLVPASAQERSFWMTTFQPAFTPDVLTSHVLLVHNLNNEWLYKINAPFWSVATEWQIYFALPLMLWTASRFGFGIMTIGCAIISILPMLVFRRFETAAPWFLILFAMGVSASYICCSEHWARLRDKVPWGWLSGTGIAILLFVHSGALFAPASWKSRGVLEVFVGAATSMLLVWLFVGKSTLRGRAVNLLMMTPLRFLGAMSYSLYLTHAIPLCLLSVLLSVFCSDISAMVKLLLMLSFGTLSSVLFAAIFYLPFERPFAPGARRTANRSQRATVALVQSGGST